MNTKELLHDCWIEAIAHAEDRLSGNAPVYKSFDEWHRSKAENLPISHVRLSSEKIEELWGNFCYEVPDDDPVKVHGLIGTKQMNRRRFIEAISSLSDEA